MLGWLSFAFFVIGFALAIGIWGRSILSQRPAFADFYARTDSYWLAVKLKLTTLRTKLAAAFLMIADGLLGLHDFIVAITADLTGVDWTPITQKVPPWTWPIIMFSNAALFYWLRNLTAKHQEQVVQAVSEGMSPAQAAVMIPSDTDKP